MLPHTSEKWLGTCCDKINPRPVAERLETTHSNFLEAIKPCQGPEEIPKNKPFKTKEDLPQQQTLHAGRQGWLRTTRSTSRGYNNSIRVNRSRSIFKTGFMVMFHDFQITFLPAVDGA